jgi:hypothetical protein
MMTEKGAMTPELTEAMLAAVAPDMMNAVKAAQQASSVAPLPPAVQDVLAGETPAPEGATPEESATPEAEGATPPTEEVAQ